MGTYADPDAIGYRTSTLHDNLGGPLCICGPLLTQTCGGILIWMEISISKSYFYYSLWKDFGFWNTTVLLICHPGLHISPENDAREGFAVSQELCGNQPPPKHLSLSSKRRLIKGLPVHLLSEYQINSCTLTISFIGVVVGGSGGEGWVGRASLPTLTYERKWICFVKE